MINLLRSFVSIFQTLSVAFVLLMGAGALPAGANLPSYSAVPLFSVDRIAGFFFSGGDGDNVSVAAAIAQSGIANNRQLHTKEINALKEYARSLAGTDGLSEAEWLNALTLEAMRQVDSRHSEQIEANPLAAAKLSELTSTYKTETGKDFILSELGGRLGFLNETNEKLFNNNLVNLQHVALNADFYNTALSGWSPAGYDGLHKYVSASDLLIVSNVRFDPHSVEQLIPDDLNKFATKEQLAAARSIQMIGLVQQTAAAHKRLVAAKSLLKDQLANIKGAERDGYLDIKRNLDTAIYKAESRLLESSQTINFYIQEGIGPGIGNEIVSGISGLVLLGADLGLHAFSDEAARRNADRLDGMLYLVKNLDKLPAALRDAVQSKARAMNDALNEGRFEDAGEIAGSFYAQIGGLVSSGTGVVVGGVKLTQSLAKLVPDYKKKPEAKKPEGQSGGDYVDILPPESRKHILYGDGPDSGGHLWPGQPGKTPFPENWSADKIIHTIGDITTSPNTKWYAQTGNGGKYTNNGDPANWVAWANVDGVRIRVVYQPGPGRVVTGFPDNKPIPNLKEIP